MFDRKCQPGIILALYLRQNSIQSRNLSLYLWTSQRWFSYLLMVWTQTIEELSARYISDADLELSLSATRRAFASLMPARNKSFRLKKEQKYSTISVSFALMMIIFFSILKQKKGKV